MVFVVIQTNICSIVFLEAITEGWLNSLKNTGTGSDRLSEIHAFYKQHFYMQRQAEIGKKINKC